MKLEYYDDSPKDSNVKGLSYNIINTMPHEIEKLSSNTFTDRGSPKLDTKKL